MTKQKNPDSRSSSDDGDVASVEADRLTASPVVLRGNSDPFAALPMGITPLVNQALTFMRDAFFPSLHFNPFFRRLYGDYHGSLTVLDDISWLPAQTAKQGWQFATTSLNSEGQALACITGFLHNLAELMPEDGRLKMNRQALALTTKSSELLRKSLERRDGDASDTSTARTQMPLHDRAVITHIFWLFRAATVTNNKASVAAHGKILAQSMMQCFNDGVVDHLMIIQAINDDVDDACKTMSRRTHFDPDWYAAICTPIWAMVEPILPAVPEEVLTNIDATVELPELRVLFVKARHMSSYSEDGIQVPDAAWGPPDQKHLAFSWFVTRSEFVMSSALKLYWDLCEDRLSSDVSISRDDGVASGFRARALTLTPGQRLTQAALTLGVLYYLRVLGHEARINGHDIRDASPAMIRHLRRLMERIARVATPDEKQRYHDAHAWLLYLGAMHEERSGSTISSSHVVRERGRPSTVRGDVERETEMQAQRDEEEDDDDDEAAFDRAGLWFHHRLARHVLRSREAIAGSTSTSTSTTPPQPPPQEHAEFWPQYRLIFRRFYHSDWAQPVGKTWFDRTISKVAAAAVAA